MDTDPTPGTVFERQDLTGARLRKVQLCDADFRMVDLGGAVLRDVSLRDASIDGSDITGLLIDGVEVAPLIEAELTRREPARAWRRARDPQGLRRAWDELERSWATTYARVGTLPAEAVDASVRGEWSFSTTLRHLVFATDAWLGAVRGDPAPFHPWGVAFTEAEEFMDVSRLGLDDAAQPSYAEVLELRHDRVAQVRDYLQAVTPDELAAEVTAPPWDDGAPVSVLACLQVIVNEECEHHRFAERDLDVVAAG